MSISHCYCSDYMTKPTQFGDEPKILLTLVALVTLSASVSAQNFTVKKTEYKNLKYSWGSGSSLKGWIGYDAGLVGDVTATVLGVKRLEFKNNTALFFKVGITFEYDWINPDGSVGVKRGQYYESPLISPWGSWASQGIVNCIALRIKSMKVVQWKRPKGQ